MVKDSREFRSSTELMVPSEEGSRAAKFRLYKSQSALLDLIHLPPTIFRQMVKVMSAWSERDGFSQTSQLVTHFKVEGGSARVMSMTSLLFATLKVGVLPMLHQYRSEAARNSARSCPLGFTFELPQPV